MLSEHKNSRKRIQQVLRKATGHKISFSVVVVNLSFAKVKIECTKCTGRCERRESNVILFRSLATSISNSKQRHLLPLLLVLWVPQINERRQIWRSNTKIKTEKQIKKKRHSNRSLALIHAITWYVCLGSICMGFSIYFQIHSLPHGVLSIVPSFVSVNLFSLPCGTCVLTLLRSNNIEKAKRIYVKCAPNSFFAGEFNSKMKVKNAMHVKKCDFMEKQ